MSSTERKLGRSTTERSSEEKKWRAQIRPLERALRYEFPKDKNLLRSALTRPSAVGHVENASAQSNEFLKSIGGTIINTSITLLFARLMGEVKGSAPALDQKVKRFDSLKYLIKVAHQLELKRHVMLHEEHHDDDSYLADSVEAIIGAIVFGSSFRVAQKVVLRLWEPFTHAGVAAPEKKRDPQPAAADVDPDEEKARLQLRDAVLKYNADDLKKGLASFVSAYGPAGLDRADASGKHNTLLTFAMSNRNWEAIGALLTAGASWQAASGRGETPAAIARTYGRKARKKWLPLREGLQNQLGISLE